MKTHKFLFGVIILLCLSLSTLAQRDEFSIQLGVEESSDLISHLDDVFIMDIRDEKTFSNGHLPGSMNIPLSEISERMSSVDKLRTLLLYAQDDEIRLACSKLWEMGFRKIYTISGGYNQWVEKQYSVSDLKQKENSSRTKDPDMEIIHPVQKSNSVYCASIGGSKKYEYLESVEVNEVANGVMSLTVIVYITNPDNCGYGEACPVYDDSPEYINAWIDWNGDEVYSANERIMNVALTGYIGINYLGTMSTSTVFSIPEGAKNIANMRINLGWGYDPDDPCDYSWDWGDVMEKQIELNLDPPVIQDLVITGNPYAAYPVTNDPSISGAEKVKIEAIVTNTEGYEITDIKWSGGLPKGEGNPYEYTAEAGSHGKKLIVCNLSYKNQQSGISGSTSFSKTFQLFFSKNGDDNDNGDPNWFEYWKKDGAVPGMSSAKYSTKIPGYGRMSNTGVMKLSDLAAGQHYTFPLELKTHFGTESFGGPTVTGIDCAAEVVAHENYHYWVTQQWKSGGVFNGKEDSDKGLLGIKYNDRLPDDYETSTSHTKNSTTDTYDLETIKHSSYARYGDEEYMAMRAGDNARGIVEKDWAYPGKQTAGASKSAYRINESYLAYDPVDATISGQITDSGIDWDQDGKYDILVFSPELDVQSGGPVNVVAILKDKENTELGIFNKLLFLPDGLAPINIDFPGEAISENKIDGPYTMSLLICNEYGDTLDILNSAYTSYTYSYEDFQPKKLLFTGEYFDKGIDTDQNGLFDSLQVELNLYSEESGPYLLEGGLYTQEGDVIGYCIKNTLLDEGINTMSLSFSGKAINAQRSDGPYLLHYLAVSNEEDNDFIYEAYTTEAYSIEDFEFAPVPLLSLTGDYSYRITDLDADCIYDYLVVESTISLSDSGNVVIKALLEDPNGSEISTAENLQHFDSAGIHSISLYFDAISIYRNATDGPYTVKNIYAYHTGDPTQADFNVEAISTPGYSFQNFDTIPGGLETEVEESICEGESFMIGDSYYTTAGIYQNHLTNEFGCDSIVNINLTVHQNPVVNLGDDRNIVDGESIILNGGDDFSSYYWSNGNTDSAIELDSTVGTGTHTYILLVTDQNNCIGSDTIQVTVVSTVGWLTADSDNHQIEIFPNPAGESIHVNAPGMKDYAELYIYSETGQLLLHEQVMSEKGRVSRDINIAHFPEGLYLVQIVSQSSNCSAKFVKRKL